MALIELKLSSQELATTTNVTVLYSDTIINNKNKGFDVLFLLHGYTGTNYDWTRYTNIDKLISNKRLIVVMPNGGNSFYTNMKYGVNYFNFLTKELPNKIENIFNIKLTNKNTHIGGLSMGGYGALKAALTYPNKYKSVFSFSGVLDIKTLYERLTGREKQIYSVFGTENEIDLNKHDLYELAKNNDISNLVIHTSCGLQDFLYKDNLAFSKFMSKQNINYTYFESNGDHNWNYWNSEIERILDILFDSVE